MSMKLLARVTPLLSVAFCAICVASHMAQAGIRPLPSGGCRSMRSGIRPSPRELEVLRPRHAGRGAEWDVLQAELAPAAAELVLPDVHTPAHAPAPVERHRRELTAVVDEVEHLEAGSDVVRRVVVRDVATPRGDPHDGGAPDLDLGVRPPVGNVVEHRREDRAAAGERDLAPPAHARAEPDRFDAFGDAGVDVGSRHGWLLRNRPTPHSVAATLPTFSHVRKKKLAGALPSFRRYS